MDKRLMVALDVNRFEQVEQLVKVLNGRVGVYKVGMELFYSCGEKTLRWLQERDKEIFLDLKLHDIPNTVAQGVAALTRLGASYVSIHTGGGRAMMTAAAAAAQESAERTGAIRPKLLGITLLTSMSEADWQETGGNGLLADQVKRLAVLAQESGLDGVVASAKEAALIRAACGSDFLVVTPGIRLSGGASHDQQRVGDPRSALASGASHLVVGRAITAAGDPVQAAELILEQMQ